MNLPSLWLRDSYGEASPPTPVRLAQGFGGKPVVCHASGSVVQGARQTE